VDIKDKVVKALSEALMPEYVRLEEDDGISGFVVSRLFEGMSALDRQGKIDEAMRSASLSRDERREVLMVAGLTPAEYDSVGARIRVQGVKEKAKGAVDILLHGGRSDAEYVRGALNNQKGVRTTEPKPVSGAVGVLMSFRATGTTTDPLTKEKAIRVLKQDPYIEVMSNA
jgi:hypothetical protein